MLCTACGCEQVPGQFCRQCGARLAAPAAIPQQQMAYQQGYNPYAAALAAQQCMRVRQNLQPLGITWIVFGVYRIVMGLVGSFLLHNMVHGGLFSDAPPFLPHLLGSMVPVIMGLTVVMGAGSIVVGYGLLARQSWGRILAIIFGILALIKIPFGTALGIYTLWVLAPQVSLAEWESLTQHPRV